MRITVKSQDLTILDIKIKELLLLYLYCGNIPLGVNPEDVDVLIDGESIGNLEIGVEE